MIPGGRGAPPPAPRTANVYVPPPSIGPHPAGVNPTAPPSHTDITSSGPGYGSAQANSYKATPAYRSTVAQVFRAQPVHQQAAVIAGMVHARAFNTPEFHAVRSVWDTLNTPTKASIYQLIPHDLGSFVNASGGPAVTNPLTGRLVQPKGLDLSGVGSGLNAFARMLSTGHIPGASSVGQSIGQQAERAALGKPINPASAAEKALQSAGGNLSGLIQSIPTSGGMTPGQQIAAQTTGLGPGQAAKNFLKDAVQLPAQVGPSIAQPVSQLAAGHPGAAAQSVVGPLVQTVKHPELALQHPLDTYLMFGGPVHGVAQILDQGVRGALKKPADLSGPSVHLTGKLTHESPNLSKSPIMRASQKAVANTKYHRTALGDLVPNSDIRLNRQIRQGVSQRVGMDERIRRVQVDAQQRAHAKAVLAPKLQRAVQATKKALTYNPQPALIKGANALALIAEGTIRRPDTAVHDLGLEIANVKAHLPDLAGQPKALAESQKYIALLEKEYAAWRKDPQLAKTLAPAFAAAEKHGFATEGLQAQAWAHNHFGKDVTPQMLERRVLTPIAARHMEGASFDPVLQTVVRKAPKEAVDAAVAKLRGEAAVIEKSLQSRQTRAQAEAAAQAAARGEIHFGSNAGELLLNSPRLQELYKEIQHIRDTQSLPVSTKEMQHFANHETGGRNLSYASHQAPRGDSAFYVKSQDFPRQQVKRNTMFAFNHGLRDPSHQALLQGRVYLQGVVSAHQAMDRMLGLLTDKHPSGGDWRSFDEASKDAPPGYRPIQVGRVHGYHDSVPSEARNASTMDREAQIHSLDINQRLQPSDAQGNWRLIHNQAADQLLKHKNQISPNEVLRAFKGLTNQFRRVALGSSMKHIPGVLQENLIRDIASGVFLPFHIHAFNKVHGEALKLDRQLAERRQIELTGGQVAGGTTALATRQVSRHFAGTSLERPLQSMEQFFRVPGPRHLATAWRAYSDFVINGTKRYLEETHQKAAVGKLLMQEYGSFMRLQGDAARTAAEKGYLPEQAMRRLRAGQERMFGHWTDLTPGAQTALMVSPFGMWWVNSMRWLGRLPIDHPVGTSVLAATNVSSEPQRERLGFDLFAPNRLPSYEQGGIPIGGNVLAANYYSPFGVANDPASTLGSLVLPWSSSLLEGALGVDWKGDKLSAPGQNTNRFNAHTPSDAQKGQYILNSLLGSFIPFYQKAQTIASGGGTQYDVTANGNQFLPNVVPQTKRPGSLSQGLKKAFMPARVYKMAAPGGASSSPTGGWGGGSSSGGSGGSGGWGGGSSGSSSGSGNGGWGATSGSAVQQGAGAALGALGGFLPFSSTTSTGAANTGTGKIVQAGTVAPPIVNPPAASAPSAPPAKAPSQAAAIAKMSPNQWFRYLQQQTSKGGNAVPPGFVDTGRGGIVPAAQNTQIHAAVSGNAKIISGLLDPNGPFSLLNKAPSFSQKLNTPAGTSTGMKAVIGLANAITAHHYNYEWGGGHSQIGVPGSGTGHGSGPGVGFDCSGAVSAILHAAGVLNTPLVSGQFMSFGQPGPGKGPNDVTIYATSGHVVSQIGGKFFGTSGAHNPGGGADWFNASPADYAGYTVRHVSLPAGTTPGSVAQRIPQAAQWLTRMLPPKIQQQLARRANPPQATPAGGYANNPSGPAVPQNVTPTIFAVATLKSLGIKPTSQNVQAFTAWEAQEGGHWNNSAHFNPLNTTQPMPGYSQTGSQGNIGSYTSWQQGLQATVQTLQNGRYGAILGALKNGAPVSGLSAAVSGSQWGTGGVNAAGQQLSQAQINALVRQVNGLPSSPYVGGGSSAPGGGGLPSSGSSGGGDPAQQLAAGMQAASAAGLGVPNAPSTAPVAALDQQRLQIVQQLLSGSSGSGSPWNVKSVGIPSAGAAPGSLAGSSKVWDLPKRKVKL